MACVGGHGYGELRVSKKRLWRVHRFSYLIHFGDPGDMDVCHRCDNPKCVNPTHLFLGTHRDNMRDMTAKGRNNGAFSSDRIRGSRNPNARLTAEDVVAIRQARRSGESFPSIAKRYGVRHGTVMHIVSGATWGHVPDNHP